MPKKMSLTRALTKGTIQDQAEALMRRYAPKLSLDARQLGGRNKGAWYSKTDMQIQWPVSDGLSILMHEVGHYKLNHWKECCHERELWEEVTAWLWAEKECKKLGIVFDYALAEHYFHKKKWNRKTLVTINWRHRHEQTVSSVV